MDISEALSEEVSELSLGKDSCNESGGQSTIEELLEDTSMGE